MKKWFQHSELMKAYSFIDALMDVHLLPDTPVGTNYFPTPNELFSAQTLISTGIGNVGTWFRVWMDQVPFIIRRTRSPNEQTALEHGIISVSPDARRMYMMRLVFGQMKYYEVKAQFISPASTPGPEMKELDFWALIYRPPKELGERVENGNWPSGELPPAIMDNPDGGRIRHNVIIGSDTGVSPRVGVDPVEYGRWQDEQ